MAVPVTLTVAVSGSVSTQPLVSPAAFRARTRSGALPTKFGLQYQQRKTSLFLSNVSQPPETSDHSVSPGPFICTS